MKRTISRYIRSCAAIVLLIASLAPASADCDPAAVKAQIDIILDKDAKRGAQFRKEVAEGSDSLAVIDRMVSEEIRKLLDTCRFDAAEYLARRGFPPAH